MKVRARNIFGSVAVGALACSAMIAAPAFAAPGGIDAGSSNSEVNRVQGIDRFATAIAASKAFDGLRGDTVIVANYLAWADVLAATPLAAERDANVLYSYAGELESRTKAELIRLAKAGVDNVLFVGGDGVVTDALLDEVANLKDKDGNALELNVDRVGGEDRYSTAQLLAAETVDGYKEGSIGIAATRAAVELNKDQQNAVATAKAAAAAANTQHAKATSAYINAVTAYTQAMVERSVLVGQLKTPLTAEAEEILKNEITTAKNAVDAAQAELVAAVRANDQPRIEAAQDALKEAQDTLTAKQKELEDSAGASAHNSPILTKIAAIDSKINGEKGLAAVATAASTDLATALAELNTATQNLALAPAIASAARTAAPGLVKEYNDALKDALAAGKDYPTFLATGMNFADALSAGPAAAQEQGVVLLTRDGSVPAATQSYLDSKPETFAVGGWAASAVKADTSFVGADRYETAAKVAAEYQAAGGQLALTSGLVSADAVVAGAAIANVGGAIVLTDPTTLSAATQAFFQYGDYTGAEVIVFGGTGAVSNGVVSAVKTAING